MSSRVPAGLLTAVQQLQKPLQTVGFNSSRDQTAQSPKLQRQFRTSPRFSPFDTPSEAGCDAPLFRHPDGTAIGP